MIRRALVAALAVALLAPPPLAGAADDSGAASDTAPVRKPPKKAVRRPVGVPARPSPSERRPPPSPAASRPLDRTPAKVAPSRPSPGRPIRPDPVRRPATPMDVHGTARDAVAAQVHPVAREGSLPAGAGVALHASADHRFARPDPFAAVRPIRPVPRYAWYRPYWTHWWVHPHWRWTHATTAIVWLGFYPTPWVATWVPPPRVGWVWVAGWWSGAVWIPGHWEPSFSPASWYGVGWAWAPGWWLGGVYVEGFWRRDVRPGWVWIEGYYLDDGEYVRGWWEPQSGPPLEGYGWEPGYWDGQYWVEGYWRPVTRAGFRWVSAWLDDDGLFRAGYWEPVVSRPGMVWIPGWFDGERWVEGRWIADEYQRADPENWQPEAGWDAREPAAEALEKALPPAIPFQGPPDGEG